MASEVSEASTQVLKSEDFASTSSSGSSSGALIHATTTVPGAPVLTRAKSDEPMTAASRALAMDPHAKVFDATLLSQSTSDGRPVLLEVSSHGIVFWDPTRERLLKRISIADVAAWGAKPADGTYIIMFSHDLSSMNRVTLRVRDEIGFQQELQSAARTHAVTMCKPEEKRPRRRSSLIAPIAAKLSRAVSYTVSYTSSTI